MYIGLPIALARKEWFVLFDKCLELGDLPDVRTERTGGGTHLAVDAEAFVEQFAGLRPFYPITLFNGDQAEYFADSL